MPDGRDERCRVEGGSRLRAASFLIQLLPLNEMTPFLLLPYRGAVGTTSLTKKLYAVDTINCRQTPLRLPSRNRWWEMTPLLSA